MPTAAAMDQGSSQRSLMQGDIIIFQNFQELLGARRRHIETNLSDSYMDGGGLHLAVVVGFENIGLDPGNEMIAVMSEPDHVESAEAHTFMDNFGCVQYLLDADSAFVAYRLQDGEIFSVLGDNTVPTWFRPELINVYGDGESVTDWHTLLDYSFYYHPDVHDHIARVLLDRPWTKRLWFAGQKLKADYRTDCSH